MSIKGLSKNRSLLVLVGLFALIWIVYAIGMATRAENAFSPFHNDTFWPAQQYMTASQPGLAIQIVGHVLITFVGGAFLSALVVGLLVLVRKAGGPALAKYAPLPIVLFLYVYGFLLVRGAPHIVTVIDSDAHTLSVRRLGALTLLPEDYEVIHGEDLVAIGVKVGPYFGRRNPEPVARIFVSRREGERLLIGLRPCPTSNNTECLDAANAGVTALVKALGRTLGAQATSVEGRTQGRGGKWHQTSESQQD